MRKKNYILLMILIGISIFSFNFNYVLASDDDDDDIDDEFESLNRRDLTIEIEANQIQVKSTLRNGDQIDEIQLKIKSESEGLGIEVSYEPNIASINVTELEFGIEFRKLIEFVDIDNNSIFDPLNDDIIQEINLSDFKPVIYNQINITDITSLHYFIINTTNGIFTAHIYISEEFHIVNGTLITPIQTKTDIEISDFPFLNGSSQIALYTSLESEFDYVEEEDTEDEIREYATNEKGLITEMNNFKGFYTWKNNATIDGISKNISISDLSVDDFDEDEQKIYLIYNRGSKIYHDPKIGVAGIYQIKINSGNPLLLYIIIISVISSMSIGIGYSLYHYREQLFEDHYSEKAIKSSPGKILDNMKFSSNKINNLLDNEKILSQLHGLYNNKKSSIDTLILTALSNDFYQIIELFDWEEEELADFIQEMISLTPEERKSVFAEMIDKSEQQKKNRLDVSKGLYI